MGLRAICRQIPPSVWRIALRDTPAEAHWRVGRSYRQGSRHLLSVCQSRTTPTASLHASRPAGPRHHLDRANSVVSPMLRARGRPRVVCIAHSMTRRQRLRRAIGEMSLAGALSSQIGGSPMQTGRPRQRVERQSANSLRSSRPLSFWDSQELQRSHRPGARSLGPDRRRRDQTDGATFPFGLPRSMSSGSGATCLGEAHL